MMIGEFDKALEFCFERNEIANKMDDEEYVAISLKNIGITYYKLKGRFGPPPAGRRLMLIVWGI